MEGVVTKRLGSVCGEIWWPAPRMGTCNGRVIGGGRRRVIAARVVEPEHPSPHNGLVEEKKRSAREKSTTLLFPADRFFADN